MSDREETYAKLCALMQACSAESYALAVALAEQVAPEWLQELEAIEDILLRDHIGRLRLPQPHEVWAFFINRAAFALAWDSAECLPPMRCRVVRGIIDDIERMRIDLRAARDWEIDLAEWPPAESLMLSFQQNARLYASGESPLLLESLEVRGASVEFDAAIWEKIPRLYALSVYTKNNAKSWLAGVYKLPALTRLTLHWAVACQFAPKPPHPILLEEIQLLGEKGAALPAEWLPCRSLSLRGFTRVRALPDSFYEQNQALRSLTILGFYSLKTLPDLDRLPNLTDLTMEGIGIKPERAHPQAWTNRHAYRRRYPRVSILWR